MNPVDLPTLTQAIETLYSHSGVNGNSIATAERFLSEIVNDNSITIDLSNGLAQSSDIVIFGLCNIVYQQTGKFRRNPNMEAISYYSDAIWKYLSEILEEKRKAPSPITLDRVCLCYVTLQTVDDSLLKSYSFGSGYE